MNDTLRQKIIQHYRDRPGSAEDWCLAANINPKTAAAIRLGKPVKIDTMIRIANRLGIECGGPLHDQKLFAAATLCDIFDTKKVDVCRNFKMHVRHKMLDKLSLEYMLEVINENQSDR